MSELKSKLPTRARTTLKRTAIVLDEGLVETARSLSEAKTTGEVLEEALRAFVRLRRWKLLSALKGKIRFTDGYP